MLSARRETTEETSSSDAGTKRIPGVVIACSRETPLLLTVPLERGRSVIGRTLADETRLPDERVSREHVEIAFDGEAWTLRDLGSTNGTFVDGVRATGQVTVDAPRAVVRIGNTILLLREDITPFRSAKVRVEDGIVIGPVLGHALAAVERAARTRPSVLLVGESGSGKEFAARRFHAAGPASTGPLVAVNCAAIPVGVAERLLFGARRGAFSGATEHANGYLQSADGGVLFLDELGELTLEVQAKLLRVIETKEVLAVGALRPQRVDVRLCFATNRNLRADVADGKFRADLYYRIQAPEVALPPVRTRREEIPWLVAQALSTIGGGQLKAHAKLVEACMLRPWPGNVRELLSEVREAGGEALDQGVTVVTSEHLREHAGEALTASSMPAATSQRRTATEPLSREAIASALEQNEQNLAAAARALGVHRTQLYRRMAELEMSTPGRKNA
jgi:transcriptional regulator with PAS, ATPase and Fis domain